jgi:hypothetical protein
MSLMTDSADADLAGAAVMLVLVDGMRVPDGELGGGYSRGIREVQ